jgi:hypothetical protein
LGVSSFGILVQLFAQGSPVTGILAATAASGKVGCCVWKDDCCSLIGGDC